MDFPVNIVTKKLPHTSPKINVNYPVVTQMNDAVIQRKINTAIIHTLNELLVVQQFYNPILVELLAYFRNKEQSTGNSQLKFDRLFLHWRCSWTYNHQVTYV